MAKVKLAKNQWRNSNKSIKKSAAIIAAKIIKYRHNEIIENGVAA